MTDDRPLAFTLFNAPVGCASSSSGQLSCLLWLVWPSAPAASATILETQCPRIKVNSARRGSSSIGRTCQSAALGTAPSSSATSSTSRPASAVATGSSSLVSTPLEDHALQGTASGMLPPSRGALADWDPLNPCSALDEPLAQRVGAAAWEQHDMHQRQASTSMTGNRRSDGTSSACCSSSAAQQFSCREGKHARPKFFDQVQMKMFCGGYLQDSARVEPL